MKLKILLLKTFFAIILTTATFAVVYFFLYFYDKQNTILPRFINNFNYIIFLYISIIVWYICSISPNKFTRILIWIIVIANFFVAWRFFMNGQIWFSRYQFLILFWVIILWFLITLIKHRIRYILIFIVWIWFLVILLISILPTYNRPLDLEAFYENQEIFLNYDWKNSSSYVIVKNYEWEKKYQTDIQENILFKDPKNFLDSKISFISEQATDKIKASIILNNWIIILLNPQSAIDLSKTWNIYTRKVLAWNVSSHIPEEIYKENEKTYSGINVNKESGLILFQDQIRIFEDNKNNYLIQMAWWKFINNPTVDLLIKNYITFLTNINPSKYSQNMINYNEYHKYLNIQTKQYWYEKNEQENINSDILSETNEWINQTQFLKKIIDRFR